MTRPTASRSRRAPRSAAFSLIELLVASTLAAVLMAAVLMVCAAAGRDRRVLDVARASPDRAGVVELLRRDLENAATIAQHPDGRRLVLVGHGGLDPRSLGPAGRLTRVTYRIVERRGRDAGAEPLLVRDQEYVDDRLNPQSWSELVAPGVTRLLVTPASADAEPVRESRVSTRSAVDAGDEFASSQDAGGAASSTSVTPSRVRLVVECRDGVIDQELRLR